jgi:hypothetical protein
MRFCIKLNLARPCRPGNGANGIRQGRAAGLVRFGKTRFARVINDLYFYKKKEKMRTALRNAMITATLMLGGVSASKAQYEMDQVLRIGYRLGTESFSPAYSTYTFNTSTSTYTLNESFKDHMGLSNLEVWYCRYSPHAFYEADLDGVFSALMNYIRDTRYEYEGLFSKFKNSTANTGYQVHGIDYDFFNMRLAFGTKGIYLGGQFKWTRLGSYTDDDNNTGNMVANSFGHSETDVRGAGLGLHANITVKDFVTQTHLMFNWLKGEKVDAGTPFFQGTEIEFESIISYGKGFGGYITPFIKKRTGHGNPSSTNLYDTAFNSSFAFGIKIGIYLAQESDDDDVYITVQ